MIVAHPGRSGHRHLRHTVCVDQGPGGAAGTGTISSEVGDSSSVVSATPRPGSSRTVDLVSSPPVGRFCRSVRSLRSAPASPWAVTSRASATISLPYLRVANVQDGHIDTTEMKTVAVRVEEISQFQLQAGDVVMTEGGDIGESLARHVWNGSISPCLHQNHIFRVRARRARLNPHYLAAVIAAEYGKRYFMRIAKRTTNLASINKTRLRAFPVPLPPLDEQERIIEILTAAARNFEPLESAVEYSSAVEAQFDARPADRTDRVNPGEPGASAPGLCAGRNPGADAPGSPA